MITGMYENGNTEDEERRTGFKAWQSNRVNNICSLAHSNCITYIYRHILYECSRQCPVVYLDATNGS